MVIVGFVPGAKFFNAQIISSVNSFEIKKNSDINTYQYKKCKSRFP